jgi:hypothetical protein
MLFVHRIVVIVVTYCKDSNILWVRRPSSFQYCPNDPEKPGSAAFEDHETMGHWASDNVGKNELISYQTEWNTSSLYGINWAEIREKGVW